jgi:hypothetical protein
MGIDVARRVHSSSSKERQSERHQSRDAEDQPNGSRAARVQTRKLMHMWILARPRRIRLRACRVGAPG